MSEDGSVMVNGAVRTMCAGVDRSRDGGNEDAVLFTYGHVFTVPCLPLLCMAGSCWCGGKQHVFHRPTHPDMHMRPVRC
jgi:hypothetical protein